MTTTPEAAYRERRAGEQDRADALIRTRERLSAVRAGVFLAVIGAVALVEPLEGGGETAAWVAAAALLVAFGFLVRRHRRVRREARWHVRLRDLADLGLARLERDWRALDAAGLPAGPDRLPADDHAYAGDLHLFGAMSLFRLAGPVTTTAGRERLAEWLLAAEGGARADAVSGRQEAVRALAPAADFRHELAARGMERDPESGAAVETFLGWAERGGWLRPKQALAVAAWVLPALTFALAWWDFAGDAGAFWLLPLALQVWILRRLAPRIGTDRDRFEPGAAAVQGYSAQLGLLPDEPSVPPHLREGLDGAERALRRLGMHADVAASRSNPFYQGLNFLVMADIHAHRSLERWRERYGGRVRGWLETLGEVEALSALATLAHDHPAWAYPDVLPPGEAAAESPEGPILRAEALAHPLLRPDEAVANDVEVGPPGSFLLVTGSNMSGKSTLLRAVGTAVVLGGAGAPVPAERMSLPLVRLRTSMMIGDSLASGVSRFMAELLRLRGVVEAAREGGPEQPPVLYLLDEILQGTNTKERRIAARTVLRELLERRAIGAVTTHDLTLHQAPDLERRARAYHFRETVTRDDAGPRLDFDYQLRPGLSTTTNALELLEAVGLGSVEAREDAS